MGEAFITSDGAEAARGMDEVAKSLFEPVYPVIAANAVRETGVAAGICLDLGCGPCSLAIAIARAGASRVHALDISPDAVAIGEQNVADAGLSGLISIVHADVHHMPFPNDVADLVVSRGSMFFWDDMPRAFLEIERVLKPGAKTYIGGGFGNLALHDEIVPAMIERSPSWKEHYEQSVEEDNGEIYETAVSLLEHSSSRYVDDDTGFWIIVEKTG
jgi:SAM-dependent methyltransferase